MQTLLSLSFILPFSFDLGLRFIADHHLLADLSVLLLMFEVKSELLDINIRIQCAFGTLYVVFVLFLTVRNINRYYERNEKCSQIFAHLFGGMDCVTAAYMEIADSSPTEKQHKLMFRWIPKCIQIPKSMMMLHGGRRQRGGREIF